MTTRDAGHVVCVFKRGETPDNNIIDSFISQGVSIVCDRIPLLAVIASTFILVLVDSLAL